jgi:hypothetical protein
VSELDAFAFLLERDFGFDQFNLLSAYQSAVVNEIDAESHNFLVRFGTDVDDNKRCQEVAFKTAREAADFFLSKKAELQI